MCGTGVDVLRHSNDALGVHVRVRALTVRDLMLRRAVARRASLDRVLEFEARDDDDDAAVGGAADADASNGVRCVELRVLRRPRQLAEL